VTNLPADSQPARGRLSHRLTKPFAAATVACVESR
jgi:hypothetical protein